MSEVVDAVPDVTREPAPAWTKWILTVLALASCVLAGLLYLWALRAGGVSGVNAGSGGWSAIFDVASQHRGMATLLLFSATMLALGAMLGAICVLLARGLNRVGGLLALAICIWVLGSASLTFVRWRDVHDPPQRRPPPPVQVQ